MTIHYNIPYNNDLFNMYFVAVFLTHLFQFQTQYNMVLHDSLVVCLENILHHYINIKT